MDVPGTVDEALGGEEVATRVPLGGEDALFVTPTRTLLYRGEGLLSDESVEEYAHDAERIAVSRGRRKSKFSLTYPIEGTEQFTVPAGRTDDVLSPVIAGVLNARGEIDADESVLYTYLFSELTLVITSHRLIKHVGEAVWDTDFDSFPYDRITGIDAESGDVSTQIVVEVDGRPERIKAPTDRGREVRERLEEALRGYYDLGPTDDLAAVLAPEAEAEAEPAADDDDDGSGVSFGEALEPLSTGSSDSAEESSSGGEPSGGEAALADLGAESDDDATDPLEQPDPIAGDTDPLGGGSEADPLADGDDPVATEADTELEEPDPPEDDLEAAGFEPADESTPDIETELAELRSMVQKQNSLLVRQQQTIEQLIEELRRGR